jgi:radical SAM superfamily enzyme YgiQ (UPF0313 family)
LHSYRYQSPENVLNQIDLLVNKYGIRNLKIADELFILNKKHVSQICQGITERKYNLNIWAYARVDTIDESMLEMIKNAGINWLCLGYESGNDKVRESVNKKIQSKNIIDTTNRIRNAGINIIANFIFGLPDDNLSTMNDTLNLAMNLNCEFANFYSAMAYPGSQLYLEALEKRWIKPDANWESFSQYSIACSPLPTNHISGWEVLKFRDSAWQKYFTNPLYTQMIESKFGNQTLRHIKEIVSISLERHPNNI